MATSADGTRPAVPPSPEVSVSRVRGLAALTEIESEWQALCARAATPPLFSAVWIRAHAEAYERDDQLHFVLARVRGRLAAVLPLVLERAWFRGLPIRKLRSAAGKACLRFDLSADAELWTDAVARALLQHLAQWKAWAVLELRDVPADGRVRELQRVAAAAGFPCDRWNGAQSPWVALATFQPGSNLRHKLRRTRRRLEELGAVRFEAVDQADPERLQELFRLEAAGWKGRRGGNAVLRKGERQRRFYLELARHAAAQGNLVLHRLCCGERTVASSFSLRTRETCHAVKWCYDEAFSKYSPGHLLIESIIGECQERGMGCFDFTGPDYPYKREWTQQRLDHAFLYVFRPGPVGAILRRLNIHWS